MNRWDRDWPSFPVPAWPGGARYTGSRIVYNPDRIDSFMQGGPVIEIVTIETPSLGDRTYLATDTVPARW